jgi:hypothetical protein
MTRPRICLVCWQVLLYLLAIYAGSILTGTARPEWVWSIGNPIDNQRQYYAVAYDPREGGWLAGAYSANDGKGEAVVSFSSNAQAGQVGRWWAPGDYESVSGFIAKDGRLWVLTEKDNGPTVFNAPAGGGKLEPLWSADHRDQYLFDGDGVVCIGSNRLDQGGRLAWMDGGEFTPPMFDETGRALFAWDALQFNGKWVAGTAKARAYNEPDGGRLLALGPLGWEITSYRGSGVIDIFPLNGGLGLTTALGQEYWTKDLQTFEQTYQGDPGHNLWRIEAGGRVLHYTGAGSFEGGQKVPNADFMALAASPEGVLGGTVLVDGTSYWIRAWWQ